MVHWSPLPLQVLRHSRSPMGFPHYNANSHVLAQSLLHRSSPGHYNEEKSIHSGFAYPSCSLSCQRSSENNKELSSRLEEALRSSSLRYLHIQPNVARRLRTRPLQSHSSSRIHICPRHPPSNTGRSALSPASNSSICSFPNHSKCHISKNSKHSLIMLQVLLKENTHYFRTRERISLATPMGMASKER